MIHALIQKAGELDDSCAMFNYGNGLANGSLGSKDVL
jgi:hypothetical protein